MSAHAAPLSAPASGRSLGAVARGALAEYGIGAAVGLVIAAICFYATGGLNLGPATTTDIALTIGGGALIVAACASEAPRGPRVWGLTSAGALFALALLEALSVSWSVQPNQSWIDANQALAYAAAFAGAIALVRLASSRWRSVLAGVLLATVVVCAYAVGTKILPGLLAPTPTYARLAAPFDYWNAVGLTAALGIPPALWLGARREGHGAFSGLAPALVCLLLVTALLAYSRGSLIALAVGVIFWFVVTPLRLRALAVLVIGAIGAAAVLAWEFGQPALTNDYTTLAARTPAGRDLGLLLIAAMVLCALAGLALRFAMLRNPPLPQLRRRAGAAALAGLALVPVILAVGLAASSRGLFGSISHDWHSLTTPSVPAPGNSASRLAAISSARALYWDDALKIFSAHVLRGAGAGGFQTAFLHYASPTTLVDNAHGYVVQTLADLGLIGLAVSLALMAAWLVAARRTVGPRLAAHADGGMPAERIGLLTMIACVVIFTVHSGIDWTWYVPGDALVALLCAGWVAGRGSHATALPGGRLRLVRLRSSPLLAAAAAITAALALIVAWEQWQPLRSQDAANAGALAASARHFTVAIADERRAITEDPQDYYPLVTLGYVEFAAGHPAAALKEFERAVELQPSNYETWYQLAYYEQFDANSPREALRYIAPALYLYPNYPQSLGLYTEAESAYKAQSSAASARAQRERAAAQARARRRRRRALKR